MLQEATQASGAPVEVLIYHNGIPVAVCPTKEMRRDGLLLHCGPLHFHRHTPLEVELTLGDRNRFRVQVEVTSCTPDHLDLLFQQVPEGLVQFLPPAQEESGTLARATPFV